MRVIEELRIEQHAESDLGELGSIVRDPREAVVSEACVVDRIGKSCIRRHAAARAVPTRRHGVRTMRGVVAEVHAAARNGVANVRGCQEVHAQPRRQLQQPARDGNLVFDHEDVLDRRVRLVRDLVLVHAVEEQLVLHGEVRIQVVDEIGERGQELRLQLALERRCAPEIERVVADGARVQRHADRHVA